MVECGGSPRGWKVLAEFKLGPLMAGGVLGYGGRCGELQETWGSSRSTMEVRGSFSMCCKWRNEVKKGNN